MNPNAMGLLTKQQCTRLEPSLSNPLFISYPLPSPDVTNNGSSCTSITYPISTSLRIRKLCFEDYSIKRTKEVKVAAQNNLKDGFPSIAANQVRRRAVLSLVGVNLIVANVCAVFAAPMQDMKETDVLRILKLASGVRIQDIVEGQGQEAREGDRVEFNYVCRRSNGYFVHSSVDQFSGESSPVILPLDDEQMIKGLKEVLIGMKVGGKRRALIPPSVGYVSESLQPIPEEFGPRRSLLSHAKEPLVFEVQLLKVL